MCLGERRGSRQYRKVLVDAVANAQPVMIFYFRAGRGEVSAVQIDVSSVACSKFTNAVLDIEPGSYDLWLGMRGR